MKKYMTFDYGASSGRGMLAGFDGERLSLEELHRFENNPVFAFGHYYWDALALFAELKKGLAKAKRAGHELSCIGVDTWGVDFALLDGYGQMAGNPFYYRDKLTDGEMDRVFKTVPKAELYGRTGIQFLKFNTLFQLTALKRTYPALLEKAESLLFMPDLFNYMLTGVKAAEYSIASTSQMLDVNARTWDGALLDRLGIDRRILCDIVEPGTVLGGTARCIEEETGVAAPVSAVCGHDTGSAVISVPMKKGEKCAYLSCGTWSLLGVELDAPRAGADAFEIEYTNEGGFGGTIRFLKNIMGLWIYQEVKRDIEKEKGAVSFDELDRAVESAKPFAAFIDPDDGVFMDKGGMTARIQKYCRDTGQAVPEGHGQVLRVALESLALKYRFALERLEGLLGHGIDAFHVVGGGCKDRILMGYTANALGRRVTAGPVEATAIGNTCAQMIAKGDLKDVWQARELVSRSFETEEYLPENAGEWAAAYEEFKKVLAKGG